MTDLTKRESFYFITMMIASLAMLVGILAVWGSTQESCWDLYSSEVQAIERCEQ
jgi:hypothetical protein